MGDLIPIFGIFFTIGVPVMAAAAHFVLRPMIREVAEAIHGVKLQAGKDLEARLARIEAALQEQRRAVEELLEAEQFRRQLESGRRGRAAE